MDGKGRSNNVEFLQNVEVFSKAPSEHVEDQQKFWSEIFFIDI